MRTSPKGLRELAEKAIDATGLWPSSHHKLLAHCACALRSAADDIEELEGKLRAAIKLGEMNASAAARWHARYIKPEGAENQ